MNINCYKHYKRAKIKHNEPLDGNHSIVKETEPESNCLDPAANLQEIQRTEEHVELYYEYAVSKIRTVDSRQVKCSGFFTDIL